MRRPTVASFRGVFFWMLSCVFVAFRNALRADVSLRRFRTIATTTAKHEIMKMCKMVPTVHFRVGTWGIQPIDDTDTAPFHFDVMYLTNGAIEDNFIPMGDPHQLLDAICSYIRDAVVPIDVFPLADNSASGAPVHRGLLEQSY